MAKAVATGLEREASWRRVESAIGVFERTSAIPAVWTRMAESPPSPKGASRAIEMPCTPCLASICSSSAGGSSGVSIPPLPASSLAPLEQEKFRRPRLAIRQRFLVV
eukprot:scaffold283536_cov30-Tisochrysis_lutea.AAC.1